MSATAFHEWPNKTHSSSNRKVIVMALTIGFFLIAATSAYFMFFYPKTQLAASIYPMISGNQGNQVVFENSKKISFHGTIDDGDKSYNVSLEVEGLDFEDLFKIIQEKMNGQ